MERASSPVAMTARSCDNRRRRRSTACSPPTTRTLDRSSRAWARMAPLPGRPAKPRTFARKRASSAHFEAPSTVGGPCFFPKGFRLAIAHYNGATLWFPNAAGAQPERLEWKGSHLGVTISPDGKFLITTMQESTLHGWRLADAKHMRMSGYSARVRSLSWSADGEFLATSGSEQLILWPFDGKDGPMGRQPKILARVRIACRGRCLPSAPARCGRGLCRRRGETGAGRGRRADLVRAKRTGKR